MEIKVISKKLYDNNGASMITVAVCFVVFLLMAVGTFEIVRINIISKNVRDKFQSAIITASTANYANLYQTVREGYSASYTYTEFSWAECNTTTRGKIMNTILSDFTSGEDNQVAVRDISFSVVPATAAPTNKSAQNFNISGQLVISIPYAFAWQTLPPIELKIDVRSSWKMMF